MAKKQNKSSASQLWITKLINVHSGSLIKKGRLLYTD
jgi:hypothetical protein